MSIQAFIQYEILLPRLKQNGVLVVYDPAQRYRELCRDLASDSRKVIDATESSIESRETAIRILGKLSQPNASLQELLVYVPAQAPLTDEAKQVDPFALYTVCGSFFPEGDGDEYMSLCLNDEPGVKSSIIYIFLADLHHTRPVPRHPLS